VDIRQLDEFGYPEYACPECKALFLTDVWPDAELLHRCPVCNYTSDELRAFDTLWRGFDVDWLLVDYLTHAHGLGQFVSQEIEGGTGAFLSNGLLKLIGLTQYFVRIISPTLDPILLGSLVALHQRGVAVSGVLGSSADVASAVGHIMMDMPLFDVRVDRTFASPIQAASSPWVSLIVIDGLVAVLLKAPLLLDSVDLGLDVTEGVVTDIDRVVDLHNALFSPAYARCK
jgi:hypothetical protein